MIFGARRFLRSHGYQGYLPERRKPVLLKAKGKCCIQEQTGRARKYLDGQSEKEGLDEDIREKLAAWMTAPGNPWFSRAIVNRLLKYYLGRGLVEPVDDFRITNPPTNQALLDALSKDFRRKRVQPPHSIRLILNSACTSFRASPIARTAPMS